MFRAGRAVAWCLRHYATHRQVVGSIPDGVIGIFQSHSGPVVGSTSYRNKYQVYFLGGKSDRCVRLTTLPSSCAVVMKSGNLNFLESSVPLQACNGTALPLHVSSRLTAHHQEVLLCIYSNWSPFMLTGC
jgi:hypothetical protein